MVLPNGTMSQGGAIQKCSTAPKRGRLGAKTEFPTTLWLLLIVAVGLGSCSRPANDFHVSESDFP